MQRLLATQGAKTKNSRVVSPKQKDIYTKPLGSGPYKQDHHSSCTCLSWPTKANHELGRYSRSLPLAAELQAVFSCGPNHERTTHQQVFLNLWTHTTLVNISKLHTKQKVLNEGKGLGEESGQW